MLEKAKIGDAVRVDNTIFVKQPGSVWKSVFDTYMESTFLRKIAGKKVDYLFLEKKEPVRQEKIEKNHQKIETNRFSLEIEPKEIKKDVQKGKNQAE